MREMVSTMVMVMKNGYDERKCKDDDAYKVDDDEDEYNTRGRWMLTVDEFYLSIHSFPILL